MEDGSSNVLESSVSGQDVTEEYIDLESRLKSKRVVEERLQSFLKEAEKTEDLLKISGDLEKSPARDRGNNRPYEISGKQD